MTKTRFIKHQKPQQIGQIFQQEIDQILLEKIKEKILRNSEKVEKYENSKVFERNVTTPDSSNKDQQTLVDL